MITVSAGPSVTCLCYACLCSLDSEYLQSKDVPESGLMLSSCRDQTPTSPQWHQREAGAHLHCYLSNIVVGGSSRRHSDQMNCLDPSPHDHDRSIYSSC